MLLAHTPRFQRRIDTHEVWTFLMRKLSSAYCGIFSDLAEMAEEVNLNSTGLPTDFEWPSIRCVSVCSAAPMQMYVPSEASEMPRHTAKKR